MSEIVDDYEFYDPETDIYKTSLKELEQTEFVFGLDLESLNIDINTPGSLWLKKSKLGFNDEQIYLIQLFTAFTYLKKRGIPYSNQEFEFIVKKLPNIKKHTFKNPLNLLLGFKVIDYKKKVIDKKKFDNIVKTALPEITEYRVSDTDLIKYGTLWNNSL
jgi:hypothetical protein